MIVMERFLDCLKTIGYSIVECRMGVEYFAWLHHDKWQQVTAIRLFDNGETLSIYNFVLDKTDVISLPYLKDGYLRSLDHPDPRSDEYEGYIAYNKSLNDGH